MVFEEISKPGVIQGEWHSLDFFGFTVISGKHRSVAELHISKNWEKASSGSVCCKIFWNEVVFKMSWKLFWVELLTFRVLNG